MMGYVDDGHRSPRGRLPLRDLHHDHEPAHVHVFGDGEAKIDLIGPGDAPELIWAIDMTRGDIRRAMAIVAQQRATFLERWREIHN